MMLLFTRFFLLPSALVIYLAGGSKQINITIMVPGIKAFRTLTEEITQFYQFLDGEDVEYKGGYYDQQYFHNSGELEKDLLPIKAYSQFNNFAYNENEVKDQDGHFDLDRFLHEHHHTYSWSYAFIKPALDIALDDIKQYKYLEDYQLNLCYYDSGDKIGKTSERLEQ